MARSERERKLQEDLPDGDDGEIGWERPRVRVSSDFVSSQ